MYKQAGRGSGCHELRAESKNEFSSCAGTKENQDDAQQNQKSKNVSPGLRSWVSEGKEMTRCA